jgi:hypothetical protein
MVIECLSLQSNDVIIYKDPYDTLDAPVPNYS